MFLMVLCLTVLSNAIELTFELDDNAKECFYEDVDKDEEITLEYQVYIFFLYSITEIAYSHEVQFNSADSD